MTLGFTGTQRGMARKQIQVVGELFEELQLTTLHHGDCNGADAQAHILAAGRGVYIVAHPPLEEKKRAFCVADYYHPAKDYLERNDDIVNAAVDGLIAAPFELQEMVRSGTWATIRFAKVVGIPIHIVFHDGTFQYIPRHQPSL